MYIYIHIHIHICLEHHVKSHCKFIINLVLTMRLKRFHTANECGRSLQA